MFLRISEPLNAVVYVIITIALIPMGMNISSYIMNHHDIIN